MPTKINPLTIRQRLGRTQWEPPRPLTSDSWIFDHRVDGRRIIVSDHVMDDAPAEDRFAWVHASVSRRDEMPTYDDLAELHAAVWGGTGHAYQVFVPREHHINIHAHALHLWGRHDGAPALPDFAQGGATI